MDTKGGVGAAPPAVRSVKSVGRSSICGPRILASLFRPAPTDFTDSRRPQIPQIDTEGGVGGPPAVRSLKSVGGSSICGPRILASLFHIAPTDVTDSRRPQSPQTDTEGGAGCAA